MSQKIEAQYIGRYGEELEDVRYVGNGITPETALLEAVGLDEKGVKRTVQFDVSLETGKKHGRYTIYRTKKCINPSDRDKIEDCSYLNDLLHGDDLFYDEAGGIIKKVHFLRGRQLRGMSRRYRYNPTAPGSDCALVFGETEKKGRKNAAEKSLELRKLFSDASVKEAIKTGNLVKVKSAMTRAIKKKEMGK